MRSLIRLMNNYGTIVTVKNNRVPVFFTDRYQPCFNPEQGDCDACVMVISIPKSGTYMVGALLNSLSFIDTKIHVNIGGSVYSDFRFVPIEEQKNSVQYARHLRLKETLKLILPGQYVVSHLNYNQKHAGLTQDFKKIFVYRDLRDNLISYLNWYFVSDKQSEHRKLWENEQDTSLRFLKFLKYEGLKIFEQFQQIAEWHDKDDVFLFRYEEFIGDYGNERADRLFTALIKYLGYEGDCDVAAIRQAVLGGNTRTKSSKRSNWKEVWNDDINDVFKELGFEQLNKRLGCEGC